LWYSFVLAAVVHVSAASVVLVVQLCLCCCGALTACAAAFVRVHADVVLLFDATGLQQVQLDGCGHI
jgi:hypothetical protein